MALGRLSILQERILIILAGLEPAWTLSGGAALAGFHTAHRDTRDLNLFWQRRSDLGDAVALVRQRLEQAGLLVTSVQTQSAFAKLDVSDAAGEHVALDLVADPVPPS